MKNRFDELKEKADSLAKPTTELNTKLGQVEAAFIKMNLGVCAEVPLGASGVHRLSFEKRGGKWGLFVGNDPILQTSRKNRAWAAQAMPALVELLCVTVDTERDDIVKALEKLDAVLEALEGS